MSVDRYRVDPGGSFRLATVDPRDRSAFPELKKSTSVHELRSMRQHLAKLQALLWADGNRAVLVILQAMDTGGKDGTIRKVFSGVNPQGVDVRGFGVPSDLEREHDYLWRVHLQAPRRGRIGIFNRSHYEDVLVVRVNDLVEPDRWHKRYQHIRDFEQMLVDEGTSIVKIMLHISMDEQRERLQSRLDDPSKNYKFNPADLDSRAKWDNYMTAYEDAINKTSTESAPWYVVPADRKWHRNLVVAQILIDTIESLDLSYPAPLHDLSSIEII